MSWAHYLLQVNIYLLVFYGFYKLLLDKETYFTLNRIYLVSAGLLSLAIPYLRFEWFTKQEAIQPVYVSVGQLMGQVSIVEEAPSGFNTGNLIVFIYLTGLLFFSARLILRLSAIGQKLKQKDKGEAFSFFHKKRIDDNLPQLKIIHKHEDTHIGQWHSADVLFFEVLSVFNWFNPIIYLYQNAVKNIHEYLADEAAAKFQGDKEQYSLLLLSNAFGVPVNTLTNSFYNKSLIKKRIFMLHKHRSPKIAVLKYGLFIPLFAIALMMSSATIRSNAQIEEIADNLPLNTPIEAVTTVVRESIKPFTPKSLDKSEIVPQKSVQAPGNWDEFYKFMKRNLRYPIAARKEKIQGTTVLKFTVAGGQIENLGIVSRLGEGCDAEAMRSLVSFPGYKSIKDGKYSLAVSFQLEGADNSAQNKKTNPVPGYIALEKITVMAYNGAEIVGSANDDQKVYDFVSIDAQPGFPGGMSKFYDYLKQAIKYPAEALKNNVQGKVFLSFIVETNGDLSNIQVERKLGSGTDEEAIRVMKGSPRWLPGTQGGTPVRVKYNIPINFSLNKTAVPTADPQNKQGSTPASGNNIGIRFSDEHGGAVAFGEHAENNPLVILDGKAIDMAEMKAMDPNKIESVTVLKGAQATALYGAKGSKGVIVIKSKSTSVTPTPPSGN